MSRAQEIVDQITESERYARLFEDRVFTDEPILTTGRDAVRRRRETRTENPVPSSSITYDPKPSTTVSSNSDTPDSSSSPSSQPTTSCKPTSLPLPKSWSLSLDTSDVASDYLGDSGTNGLDAQDEVHSTTPTSGRQEPLFIDLIEPLGPLGKLGGSDGGSSGGDAIRMQPRGVQLPHTLRALRRLERGHSSWSLTAGGGSKVFYEQAKLTEDYTDDFEGNGSEVFVAGPYPTYQLMSDYELRTYFAWRTRFRAGEVPSCPGSFRLLHAFELLSGVGAKPGPEGLAALQHLAASYAGINATFDAQMRRWMHDYVIYWDLPAQELRAHGGVLTQAEAVSVLAETEKALLASVGDRITHPRVKAEWPITEKQREKIGVPDESTLLDALCVLSRYRAEKSRFVKERRAEVEIVAARVFADMVSHCAKRRRIGYVESLFGEPLRVSYTMFPQALFWTETRHADSRYQVSSAEAFTCERGFWWHEMPCRRLETNKELGNLLHTIDNQLRVACDYQNKLKPRKTPKYQAAFVKDEIDWLVAERKRQEAARIRIDYSSLEAIRSSQVRIREALLTDEERAVDGVMAEEGVGTPMVPAPGVNVLVESGEPVVEAKKTSKPKEIVSNDEVDQLDETRQRREVVRINIDRSSLEAIRSSQVRIREALLTDDERSVDENVVIEGAEASATPVPVMDESIESGRQAVMEETAATEQRQETVTQASVGSALGLTDRQTDLLVALLEGGELPSTGAASFLSLDVDAINECFLDVVGDTVVEFVGEEPRIIEDYEDDVREALGL